jgi:hypothetical protein
MPQYIDAFGFIFLRVGGSTLILVGLVVYAQRKIDLGDFSRIIAAFFELL